MRNRARKIEVHFIELWELHQVAFLVPPYFGSLIWRARPWSFGVSPVLSRAYPLIHDPPWGKCSYEIFSVLPRGALVGRLTVAVIGFPSMVNPAPADAGLM